AEDDQSVTLKSENDAVKVIQRKDIEGKIRVQEVSLMPEGLANNMTVQDFRDLIRSTMAHPFLTEVKVAGPFARSSAPEPEVAFKAENVRTPVIGPPGRIPLPASKGETISYVGSEVTSPKELRTRLQIGAAYPVAVRLNGKQVYAGQPSSKETSPDQAS